METSDNKWREKRSFSTNTEKKLQKIFVFKYFDEICQVHPSSTQSIGSKIDFWRLFNMISEPCETNKCLRMTTRYKAWIDSRQNCYICLQNEYFIKITINYSVLFMPNFNRFTIISTFSFHAPNFKQMILIKNQFRMW